jgi:hypothetical protein
MFKKNKKELTEEEKAIRKKGRFMKCIITYCLFFIAATNVWALYILYKTGYNAYSIVNSINAVHGGELILCCVKKILSDPERVSKKSNKNSLNDAEPNDTVNNSSNKSPSNDLCGSNFNSDNYINNHSGLRGE